MQVESRGVSQETDRYQYRPALLEELHEPTDSGLLGLSGQVRIYLSHNYPETPSDDTVSESHLLKLGVQYMLCTQVSASERLPWDFLASGLLSVAGLKVYRQAWAWNITYDDFVRAAFVLAFGVESFGQRERAAEERARFGSERESQLHGRYHGFTTSAANVNTISGNRNPRRNPNLDYFIESCD